jgi:hypothetical protein
MVMIDFILIAELAHWKASADWGLSQRTDPNKQAEIGRSGSSFDGGAC